MTDLKKLAARQGELMAVAGVVILTVATIGTAPFGVMSLGAVAGARLALQAAGLVLVYRANRVINFAQLGVGTVAGTVFLALVQRRAFLRGLHAVCGGCLPSTGPKTGATGLGGQLHGSALAVTLVPRWLAQLDFVVSAAVAVALSVAILWLVYTLLIKRFAQAPRLVLTVIMIAAGEVARLAGTFVLNQIFKPTSADPLLRPEPVEFPSALRFSVGHSVFRATDVATVLIALLIAVGLVLLLRRSTVGVVLRGAAENPDRAKTLGVNVGALSSRAWLMAGALSGIASVLVASKSGAAGIDGYPYLLRALTAAVVGGFVSFPLVLVGALVVGILDQVVQYQTNSEALVAGLLFVLVLAVLLVQRSRASRAELDAQGTWEATREIRPIPAELARLPVVRKWIRVGGALAAIAVLGYPWIMSPAQIQTAIASMVLGMVGLSLLVLTGWGGQISLGQMGFAAVGAFVSSALGWPMPIALLLGGIAGGMAAVIVGIPSLRLRGLTLAVSTLAFGLATPEVLLNQRYLGRHVPAGVPRPILLGIDFDDERAFYYLTVVLLALIVGGVIGLRRSDIARVQIAAKDNEQAAQSLGISLYRTRLVAFGVSGFIAGIAGGVLTYGQRAVNLQAFGAEAGVRVFLITIIGGLGSIAGPILGALYDAALQILLTTPFASVAGLLLSPGMGVVILLIAMPGGLAQGVFGLRDGWLRRIASRYRIEVPSLVADRGHVEGEAFPLAPKLRPTGAPEVIPVRYRTAGQWMADKLVADLRASGKATRPRAVRRG